MNTILVDIDDVLLDLLSAWIKALNQEYGTNVSKDEVTDWYIPKFFPSLTKEQVFAPLYLPSFWRTVRPKPDATMYLKRLKDDGYTIYLCTSTHFSNVWPKFRVIKTYFPYIDWNHVIVASNKTMIKADVLVDDAPHNLWGGDYKKILMTAPHNKDIDEKSYGFYRANDWTEIYSLIHDLCPVTNK